MQTGNTVAEWRGKLQQKLNTSIGLQKNFPSYDPLHPNKYSGYVYDAVWLYALALDELIRTNQSYIQELHSNRSVHKFSDIIRKTDFKGVSGRINFDGSRNSRLSHINVSIYVHMVCGILDIYDCTANIYYIFIQNWGKA